MRKIILYIAMSVDGYVADKDKSVAWLSGDGSGSEEIVGYEEFYKTVDTVVMGYNTYHQIITELSPNAWPYENSKSYVISSKSLKNHENIEFTDNIVDLLKKLKAKEGKNIWICGGASIAQQAIAENLVDEFHLSVIPCILGSGIRLFTETDDIFKLKLLNTTNHNGIVNLIYVAR